MKKTILTVCTIAVLATLAACNKKQKNDDTAGSNKAPQGACHYTGEKYCNEYYGNMVTKQWIDKNNCQPLKVSVIDKCPTENAVARCTFDEGTNQERHIVIYDEKLVTAYCDLAGGKKKPL